MKIKQINKIKKKQWEKREAKRRYKLKEINSSMKTDYRKINVYFIDPLYEATLSYCLRLYFLYEQFDKDGVDTIAGYCYDDYISYKKELKEKWSLKYENNKK